MGRGCGDSRASGWRSASQDTCTLASAFPQSSEFSCRDAAALGQPLGLGQAQQFGVGKAGLSAWAEGISLRGVCVCFKGCVTWEGAAVTSLPRGCGTGFRAGGATCRNGTQARGEFNQDAWGPCAR